MPSLESLIPEITAYQRAQAVGQAQQASQLQQMGMLQGILAKAREQNQLNAFRNELASGADPAAVALKYGTPKDILGHADTQARIKANQEMAASRLAQAASQWNASMALKMKGETRADALASLKQQDVAFKQRLASAAAQYNLPKEIVDQFLTSEPTVSTENQAPQITQVVQAPQVPPEAVERRTAPTEAAGMAMFGSGKPLTVEIKQPAAPAPAPAQPSAPLGSKTPPPELEAQWEKMSPKASAAARERWMAEQAQAGNRAQKVVINEVTKELSKNYERLRDAPQQLANIEKAKALIPNARLFQGSFGEQKLAVAKFFNNNLGMDIDLKGVTSAEELRSRIFFNVMDNLKKMDAQPSQLQQKIMQDALGQLGTDPNALSHVLDAFADAIRMKVDLYEKQRTEAKATGVDWPHVISIPGGKTQASPAAPSGLAEGQKGTSKSGRPMTVRGGRWEYD